MGSVEGHAVKVVSKCLWDPNFDNYASVSYQNVIKNYFRKAYIVLVWYLDAIMSDLIYIFKNLYFLKYLFIQLFNKFITIN